MIRFLLSKIFSNREKLKGDVIKPFLDHLEDLRWTIFKMAATLIAAMAICFTWHSEVFHFLQGPLRVNGLNPADVLVTQDVIAPFMSSLTLSFYAGIVVSFPVLLYFLGEFVLPAMTDRERKYTLPALGVGFLLFLGGAWFCFHYMVPAMIKFMAEYATKNGFKVQYGVGNYFKLVALMSIVFGLLCQIPVVMVALHGIGVISYQWIKTTRSYAYAGIVTLCFVVSPSPDIPSIVMFALPIMGLYELCIWVIWFLEKRRPVEPAEPPDKGGPSITAAATAPYEPPANSGYDDPYDHPDHYNDGHYHDEHYQREHSEIADKPNETPETPPEVTTEPTPEPAPEVKPEPKPEEKPPDGDKA